MTSDFVRSVRRFATGLHRACPALQVDDLLQDALEHDVVHRSATGPHHVVGARNAMRSTYRREAWWAARVDSGADPSARPADGTPEAALLTLQLRRIVRARLAAHLEAAPELRPAVEVVLYRERPRVVAEQLHLDVEDIYRASECLRARLRADEDLQRAWREE